MGYQPPGEPPPGYKWLPNWQLAELPRDYTPVHVKGSSNNVQEMYSGYTLKKPFNFKMAFVTTLVLILIALTGFILYIKSTSTTSSDIGYTQDTQQIIYVSDPFWENECKSIMQNEVEYRSLNRDRRRMWENKLESEDD